MSVFGGIALGGLMNGVSSAIGNAVGMLRDKQMAKLNYQYGEMAADAADARTRALYNDLQSPSALLEQYKQAGLSPSLMYGQGGSAGAHPADGAQGSGASGLAPTTYGVNLMQGAEIALMKAQENKLNAEANKANADANTTNETRELVIQNLQKDIDTKLANISNVNLKNSWQEMVNVMTEVDMITKQQFGYAISQETLNQMKETTRKLKGEADSALAKGEIDQDTIGDQKRYIKAKLNNTLADTLLKKSQGELNEAQVKSLNEHLQIDWKNLELNEKQINEQVNLWIKEQEKMGAEIPKTNSDKIAKWVLGGLDSLAHVAEAVAEFF